MHVQSPLNVYLLIHYSSFRCSTSIRCHCNVQFDTVFAYDNHYNAQHRYLCTQCQKHLPSAHLLDLHLSEQHDSFFAVQAERKPMVRLPFNILCHFLDTYIPISSQYACFLEECPHKSSTPAERRDHCITQHKLPHDFRFGTKKSGGQSSNKLKPEPATATKEFQQSTDGMHSMTTQHLKIISFGHGQAKTFLFNDQCYAKRLTRNHKRKKAKHVLDDDKIMVDLLESLPN